MTAEPGQLEMGVGVHKGRENRHPRQIDLLCLGRAGAVDRPTETANPLPLDIDPTVPDRR